ncbi:DoxX family protein [Salinimicrobium oceani]|uniref:DoxX family protein n=1 Tax=Salinimicrobium oceani TaxID=2722702 RepID=UPI00293BF77F|nr:DoxX family protein [Salinimicrobium oceani]
MGVGVLMLAHGIPKVQMLFSRGEIQFPGVMGLSPVVSLALAVFAEVVCSILLIIGLGTRWASIPLIITMLVAVLLVHGGDPFANQEPGLLYLFLYLPLLFLDSGKYSVDQVINAVQRPQLAGR